ncbi:hypothetical protein EJ110_NYTH37859 [Nymphaea thermarum]|nr:hypothetical protein EJ110_NYTH37859 [Nymphaea thermarum]
MVAVKGVNQTFSLLYNGVLGDTAIYGERVLSSKLVAEKGDREGIHYESFFSNAAAAAAFLVVGDSRVGECHLLYGPAAAHLLEQEKQMLLENHKVCLSLFICICNAGCKLLLITDRKADCHGTGAACYDPRFVGGDGVVFFFHGKANEHFSLVSDTNFQINARFIGLRPQGRTRDFTWIQALGFMYGPHTFTLGAKKVMKWDNSVDQLEFFYDGQPIFLSEGHLSEWSSPDHDLKLERTARTNSIIVKLPEIAEVSVNVVPVTEEDDRIHKYQIPADDCFAHLEVQFRFYGLSPQVEGVIGKTYQPDFQSPVKKGVAMPIMGGEDKHRTPSLLSPNCKFCKFKPETEDVDHAFMAYPSTIDCATKLGNGAGIVCRK